MNQLLKEFTGALKGDFFLRKDLERIIRKCKVGFVIDNIQMYDLAMASIRTRCYDIIGYLNKNGIMAELRKPYKNYDVIVITKACSDTTVKLARKYYLSGTKIIYDAYFENLLDDRKISEEKKILRENVLTIISLSSAVITCSERQRQQFAMYHKNVYVIGEAIENNVLRNKKVHFEKKSITLVYCGYSQKARDLLEIKEVINRMHNRGNDLLIISNKDPELKEIDYEFMKYDQKKIGMQLCKGDVFIAPRSMDNIDKSDHSIMKIALPMAVGIPVVASPVPSYQNTPAILCSSEEEWNTKLQELTNKAEIREDIGEEGRAFIKMNYTLSVIGSSYKKIICQV